MYAGPSEETETLNDEADFFCSVYLFKLLIYFEDTRYCLFYSLTSFYEDTFLEPSVCTFTVRKTWIIELRSKLINIKNYLIKGILI